MQSVTINESAIRNKAYELWQSKGCPEQSAEQDWFEAERLLRASASRSVSAGGPTAMASPVMTAAGSGVSTQTAAEESNLESSRTESDAETDSQPAMRKSSRPPKAKARRSR